MPGCSSGPPPSALPHYRTTGPGPPLPAPAPGPHQSTAGRGLSVPFHQLTSVSAAALRPQSGRVTCGQAAARQREEFGAARQGAGCGVRRRGDVARTRGRHHHHHPSGCPRRDTVLGTSRVLPPHGHAHEVIRPNLVPQPHKTPGRHHGQAAAVHPPRPTLAIPTPPPPAHLSLAPALETPTARSSTRTRAHPAAVDPHRPHPLTHLRHLHRHPPRLQLRGQGAVVGRVVAQARQ